MTLLDLSEWRRTVRQIAAGGPDPLFVHGLNGYLADRPKPEPSESAACEKSGGDHGSKMAAPGCAVT